MPGHNLPRRGRPALFQNCCVVLCIVCFVSLYNSYVLSVCKCVLYFCHRVTTQLQLTNISISISIYSISSTSFYLLHCLHKWTKNISRKAACTKVKVKGRLWVLQHWCLEAYCTLTQMSSFIHLQRRCTHQAAWETSAREGRNYTWNLASNP